MAVSVPPPVVIALGTCPAHVQHLRASDLPAARHAVLSMLPTLAAHLDRRGARIEQVRFVRAKGDIEPAHPCAAARRSVLVRLFLPGERATPSLSGSPVYYVARTRRDWVIWFQPH